MTICLVEWPGYKWGTQALKAVYKIVIGTTLSKTQMTVVMIWHFLSILLVIDSSLMDQTVIISASSGWNFNYVFGKCQYNFLIQFF